jgi:hypothetical protein
MPFKRRHSPPGASWAGFRIRAGFARGSWVLSPTSAGTRAGANCISGPVVVRAIDIFTHQRVVFVGLYAEGPVVGQDTIDGLLVDQRAELVFDSSQASKAGYLSQYKLAWPITAGVPTTWSGSTGWQIDGIGFSEVFVAC